MYTIDNSPHTYDNNPNIHQQYEINHNKPMENIPQCSSNVNNADAPPLVLNSLPNEFPYMNQPNNYNFDGNNTLPNCFSDCLQPIGLKSSINELDFTIRQGQNQAWTYQLEDQDIMTVIPNGMITANSDCLVNKNPELPCKLIIGYGNNLKIDGKPNLENPVRFESNGANQHQTIPACPVPNHYRANTEAPNFPPRENKVQNKKPNADYTVIQIEDCDDTYNFRNESYGNENDFDWPKYDPKDEETFSLSDDNVQSVNQYPDDVNNLNMDTMKNSKNVKPNTKNYFSINSLENVHPTPNASQSQQDLQPSVVQVSPLQQCPSNWIEASDQSCPKKNTNVIDEELRLRVDIQNPNCNDNPQIPAKSVDSKICKDNLQVDTNFQIPEREEIVMMMRGQFCQRYQNMRQGYQSNPQQPDQTGNQNEFVVQTIPSPYNHPVQQPVYPYQAENHYQAGNTSTDRICTSCLGRVDDPRDGICFYDGLWHQQCFVCSMCRRQLDLFEVTQDYNRLYCRNCFLMRTPPPRKYSYAPQLRDYSENPE